MGNKYYLRSRRKEEQIKNDLEKDGWYSIRSAGSKGIADIIAIKPRDLEIYPDVYLVRFIQVKVSNKYKKFQIKEKAEELPFGQALIEYYLYPARKLKETKKGEK